MVESKCSWRVLSWRKIKEENEILLRSAMKQALNSRKKQQLKKNSPHEKYDSRGAVSQLAELVV
jgi:hypothetical protein